MRRFDRQSESSSPTANAGRDLDAIVNWLRGLSTAEMTELSEAMANGDAEILARFHSRFEACLKLSGEYRSW